MLCVNDCETQRLPLSGLSHRTDKIAMTLFNRQQPMTLQTKHGPVEYRRVYPRHNKGRETRPPAVELVRPVVSGGAFHLYAEDGKRKFRIPFFTNPLEVTGWRNRLWVSASDDESAKRLLSEGMTSIENALKLGATEIEHDGDNLILRWTPYREPLDGVTSFPFQENAAEVLTKLSGIIPRLFHGESGRGYRRAKRLFSSSWSIAAVVLLEILGMLAAVFASSIFPPLSWGEWASKGGPIACALPVLGLLFALRKLVRRYHFPQQEFLVTLILGATSGIPAGWAAFTAGNAIWDKSDATNYSQPIQRYWTTTGKNSTHYHAGTTLEDGSEIEKNITRNEYQRFEQGESAQLNFSLRAGAFGVRWISRRQLSWDAEALSPEENNIQKAYEYGSRQRRLYDPASSTLPPAERDFIVEYLHLMDLAVGGRVWTTLEIRGPQTPFAPWQSYPVLIKNLERLPTPEKFRESKAHALKAVQLHADFFNKWRADASLDPYKDPEHPGAALEEASRELRAAYESLSRATPGESEANRAAYLNYFAGVDFL